MSVTAQRWEKIRLLACDVDGVLTDGALTFDENGTLYQNFFVRDGFALVAARRAGLKIAWISGRPSAVAQKRFDELKLDFCILACPDKATALLDLQETHGITAEECCFIGDDLPDLPAFLHSGIRVAVADAVPEVLARADHITKNHGGRGAVREVVEHILQAQGHWPAIVERFASAATSENLQR